jgi:hypothetical protein
VGEVNEQKKVRHYSTMTQAELNAWDAEMDAKQAAEIAARKLAAKSRRQKFQTSFIIFPMRWIEALENGNADRSTHRLALRLLVAAHAREHQGGEIVLSSEVTKLQRNNKYRAAEKLQALGLVRIERRGLKQSPIIHILADRAKRKPQK